MPDEQFNKLIETIFDENSNNMTGIITDITNNGYSLVNQLKLFFDFVKDENLLKEKIIEKLKNENVEYTDIFLNHLVSTIKSKLIIKISDIDYNLLKGGDEYIEFMHLAHDFSKIINNF